MIIISTKIKNNIMIITWSKKNKKASSLSKSSSTDNSSFNNIDDVSFLSDSSFLGLMKVNESGICNSFSLSEDIEVSHCDFRAQMEKENFSYVLKHFADEIDDRTFVDKVVALYEKGNDFVIKELNKKLIDSINRLASSKNSVDIVMKAMEVSDKEEREKIVRKIKEYTRGRKIHRRMRSMTT